MYIVDRSKGAAAQGDCFIIPVEEIPSNAVEAKAENSKLIVAHSETGHHHALSAEGATLYSVPGNPMVSYLSVAAESDLEHERSFDTHETLRLPRGNYQILRQREGAPEGWRQVAD